MNVGQLFQKMYDLIVAAKAGNYLIAMSLAIEIIKAITENLPPVGFATPPKVEGDTSFDALISKLETVNNNPPMDAAMPVDGPIIDVILPILQPLIAALIRKWLGL